MSRCMLIVECVILFVGLPLAYRYSQRYLRLPALPVLWVVAAYAWWQLLRDPAFDRAQLWNTAPLGHHLGAILFIFLVAAVLIWLGVRRWAPRLQWSFVREHPGLWALVMVLYPVLSVYPQGVLYRAFFFHRYAGLVPATPAGGWVLLLASASAFAFLHIIFRNPVAIGLTFLGGLLFAWRYQHTGSLFVSGFEHALYGCWMFTVGLGQYFYHGVWPKTAETNIEK